jgi:predicted enzyme related to lactoylglutathione lyase
MATASKTMVRAIDATFYTVKDLAGATKFYTQVIGFEPTLGVPDFVSEWTFSGGETFGLYKSPEGKASGSGVMFQVDDVKTAVDACKAMGVKFDDEGEIEDTPVCHMAFASDPEGNRFIIHRRK